MKTRALIILASIIAFAAFVAIGTGFGIAKAERAKRAPQVTLVTGEPIPLRAIATASVVAIPPEPDRTGEPIGQEKQVIDNVSVQVPVISAPTCPKPNTLPQRNVFLAPVSPAYAIGIFIPENLVPLNEYVDTKYKFMCLQQETAEALKTMSEAAKADGVILVVLSAFRSFDYQETLKSKEVIPLGSHPSIAEPGHSEHQLGTAIDFTSGTNPALTFTAFANSLEYAWLMEHAIEYGFVQSYQTGKEDITGYIAEPWHWRYVGPDIASDVIEEELTLYEYLLSLVEV